MLGIGETRTGEFNDFDFPILGGIGSLASPYLNMFIKALGFRDLENWRTIFWVCLN